MQAAHPKMRKKPKTPKTFSFWNGHRQDIRSPDALLKNMANGTGAYATTPATACANVILCWSWVVARVWFT